MVTGNRMWQNDTVDVTRMMANISMDHHPAVCAVVSSTVTGIVLSCFLFKKQYWILDYSPGC